MTGPANGATPSGTPTWAITGVTGVTACNSTTGPTGSSNVATYTCSVNVSKVGTYGANFTYSGDNNYNQTSPVITASSTTTTVSKATPVVAVSATAPTNVLPGQSVVFTATVTVPTNAAGSNGYHYMDNNGRHSTYMYIGLCFNSRNSFYIHLYLHDNSSCYL